MQDANWLLIASFAVAAAIELLLPVGLAAFVVRRLGGRWRYVLLGAGVMLLFQGILRVPAMIALQIQSGFQETLKSSTAAAWLFLLFAAFTAGLFEEGGRWLALRFVVPGGDRRHATALAMGAGHGGIESMAIGIVALASLGVYLATLLPPETVPQLASQREALQRQYAEVQGWAPLLGAWERLGALAIQMGLSVMVLQAFLRGFRWWWWWALAAHTVVDFTAVGLMRLAGPHWGPIPATIAVEVLVTLYAVAAILLVRAIRDPEPVGQGSEMLGEPPRETFVEG